LFMVKLQVSTVLTLGTTEAKTYSFFSSSVSTLIYTNSAEDFRPLPCLFFQARANGRLFYNEPTYILISSIQKTSYEEKDREGKIVRTKKLWFILCLILALYTISCVNAGGVGTIRIDPAFPIMLSSPAEFEIWVQPSADPTNEPHIFLVMTESCFNGLSDTIPLTVTWTGAGSPLTIAKGEWNGPETDNGKKLPDSVPIEDGVGYTVASLKDHLGTTGPIYWAFESFLDGALTQTHKQFNVTLPSSNPRMLVYALGKTENPGGTLFNNRVPPTKPGFIVPEPATIAAVSTSLIALVGYAVLKRKR